MRFIWLRSRAISSKSYGSEIEKVIRPSFAEFNENHFRDEIFVHSRLSLLAKKVAPTLRVVDIVLLRFLITAPVIVYWILHYYLFLHEKREDCILELTQQSNVSMNRTFD